MSKLEYSLFFFVFYMYQYGYSNCIRTLVLYSILVCTFVLLYTVHSYTRMYTRMCTRTLVCILYEHIILAGHVYAIADFGGANQHGECPECHAAIVGANHRLAAGNAVATEMDGAHHPVWSEQANLANYERLHDEQ